MPTTEQVTPMTTEKEVNAEEAGEVTLKPKSRCVFAAMFQERSGSVYSLWEAFTRSPTYFWAAIGYNKKIAYLITVLLDDVLSFVVAAIMALIIYAYSTVDWAANREIYNVLLVILPFPITWNIAQYASFVIQTTGHMSILQGHGRGLLQFGPVLVGCIVLGCAMAYVAFEIGLVKTTSQISSRVAIVALVAAPPILGGLWVKTILKQRYIRRKFGNDVDGARKDSLSAKVDELCMASQGEGLRCEFGPMTVKQVLKDFTRPATCFVWTVIFSCGLVSAQQISAHPAFRWLLFVLGLAALFIGDELLKQAIKGGDSGTAVFNMKMIVAFAYIYNTIVNSQVRVLLMGFQGAHRNIGFIIHPVIVVIFRLSQSRHLKDKVEDLMKLGQTLFKELKSQDMLDVLDPSQQFTQMDTTSVSLSNSIGRVGEGVKRQVTKTLSMAPEDSAANQASSKQISDQKLLVDYTTASVRVARAQVNLVIKMLAANVAALNAVLTACILNQSPDSPFLMLGDCEDGILWNLFVNGLPFIAMDLFEIAYLVWHVGLPLYNVYFLLDPFIVVAVVVVNYMNFVLQLFAAL
jgi:hypothetical protein